MDSEYLPIPSHAIEFPVQGTGDEEPKAGLTFLPKGILDYGRRNWGGNYVNTEFRLQWQGASFVGAEYLLLGDCDDLWEFLKRINSKGGESKVIYAVDGGFCLKMDHIVDSPYCALSFLMPTEELFLDRLCKTGLAHQSRTEFRVSIAAIAIAISQLSAFLRTCKSLLGSEASDRGEN